MMTALQFVAALTAALLGVFVARLLLHCPVTLTHFAVMGGYWSAAVLAYLVPRSFSRVLRTRLLACALVLSLLTYGLFIRVARLPLLVPLPIVFQPVFAIFVFCAAAFLTGTRRSWGTVVTVLLPPLAVHFISLWGLCRGAICRAIRRRACRTW